jgi:hypothetical protein
VISDGAGISAPVWMPPDDASANVEETASSKGMKSVQTISFHTFEGKGTWLIETAVEGVCDKAAVGARHGIELI